MLIIRIETFIVPLYTPQPFDLDGSSVSSGLVDKFVPPITVGDTTTNHGFTIVGNSSVPGESHQLRVNSELMDILSNNTEIDHPLCDECCDTLISLLENELRAAEDECNQYSTFLKK